jgi:hypothetical protein
LSKRAKDKPVYAFVRVGNSLVPEMEYDMGALETVPQGQRVKVEIQHWRNNDRLRAYWAMLRECIKATECAATETALHDTIKMGVGLVDYVNLRNGGISIVPSSIALGAMNEDDMVKYFRGAEKWLAENIGFASQRAA